MPAKHTDTRYASCISPQTYTGIGGTGAEIAHKIQFAQRGGKATMSRISVFDNNTYTACSPNPSGTPPVYCPEGVNTEQPSFSFRIFEYGRLDDGATFSATTADANLAGRACSDKAGEEFNPLKETDKMGRANPYQDPNRGRIAALKL